MKTIILIILAILNLPTILIELIGVLIFKRKSCILQDRYGKEQILQTIGSTLLSLFMYIYIYYKIFR